MPFLALTICAGCSTSFYIINRPLIASYDIPGYRPTPQSKYNYMPIPYVINTTRKFPKHICNYVISHLNLFSVNNLFFLSTCLQILSGSLHFWVCNIPDALYNSHFTHVDDILQSLICFMKAFCCAQIFLL